MQPFTTMAGCAPPSYMQKKKKALDSIHKGEKKAEEIYSSQQKEFDYGPLKHLPIFQGSHPKVMQDKMKDFSWKESLNYSNTKKPDRLLFKHEKPKYKVLTFIEQNLNGGKQLFGFKNWELLDV